MVLFCGAAFAGLSSGVLMLYANAYPPTRAFPAPFGIPRILSSRRPVARGLRQLSESCGVIFPMSRSMIEAQIHGGEGEKKRFGKDRISPIRQRP
jgi:hypothetical protein